MGTSVMNNAWPPQWCPVTGTGISRRPTYYQERNESIVAFEVDPSVDINADAKIWTPHHDKWIDCPGSAGIGMSVRWGDDYYPIQEDWVEAIQERQRAAAKARKGQ